MPTKPGPLQIRIIKAIGLAGHLSNSKLTDRMNVKHPVISDAVTSLLQRRLIEFSYTDVERKTKTHKSGGRSEKYYALTKNGLSLFIDENPSPEDFFTAVLNFYTIREQSFLLQPVKIEEFENYFKRFKKKYLSYAASQGYLIQSPFFSKLYRQWIVDNKSYFFEEEYLKRITTIIHSPFLENCLDQLFEKYSMNHIPITQKVLECLAIHRTLTEEQIYEYLNSKQREIEQKLDGKYPDFVQNHMQYNYAVTKENIARTIDRYTLNKNYVQSGFHTEEYDYNQIMKSYVEYLSHLIIVKLESPKGPRYELSLFGILLILAIIADRHQKMFHTKIIDKKFEKMDKDLISFHNRISQTYPEKLPLIFGKWALLSSVNQDAYRWFLPVLNQIIDDSTQHRSVPITLGGIKEYQDYLRGITFYTTTQLFKIYQGLSSALSNSNRNSELDIPLINKDTNPEITLALLEIEKELAGFLKYADLGRFVGHIEQISQLSDSELPIIENVLANEITISFYINLIRSDYLDYTDEDEYFLGDEKDTAYKDTDEYHVLRPADFLRTIIWSDNEIKEMFVGLINDTIKYHQQTGSHMNNFYENIKKRKQRHNK